MKFIAILIGLFICHFVYAANTIIVMVPGMGQGVISAAQAYQFGVEGKAFGGNKLLNMEKLPGQGNLLKSADDDKLTIASVISTGVKPRVGRCGVDQQGIQYQNICEIAADKKMKCGVISTGRYDSPVAESLYYHNRTLIDTAKSQLLSSKIDLFIAAGYEMPADFAGKVVKNRDEYKNLTLPVRGILPGNGLKMRGIDGTKASHEEPTLQEMTDAALMALDNKNGFVLVIDAVGVDNAVNTKDAGLWAGELLGIDKTIESIEMWVAKHGGWKENSLIVIGLIEKGVTSIQSGKAGTVPKVRFYSTDYINSMPPVFFRGKIFESLKANFTNDVNYSKDMKILNPQILFFTIAENL